MEYWLIPIAFITSSISGITGLGGGTILIGAMSPLFVPTLLIPAHGVVQLVSNLSRAMLYFNRIKWNIVVTYLCGGSLGAAFGSMWVLNIPEQYFWFSIAGFLIYSVWVPKFKLMPKIPYKYPVLGAVSTFLALFIGISGPLVHGVMLREKFEKYRFISTEAALASTTHFLKVFVFVSSGVQLLPHSKLIGGMAVSSILGSYLGKILLAKLPQQYFMWGIKILVTVLALNMLRKGFLS